MPIYSSDDFGLAPLADPVVRDLLEILDDRYDRRATLITSQLPLDQWHAALDRLVYNAYKLELKRDSMRKRKSINSAPMAAQHRAPER